MTKDKEMETRNNSFMTSIFFQSKYLFRVCYKEVEKEPWKMIIKFIWKENLIKIGNILGWEKFKKV